MRCGGEGGGGEMESMGMDREEGCQTIALKYCSRQVYFVNGSAEMRNDIDMSNNLHVSVELHKI